MNRYFAVMLLALMAYGCADISSGLFGERLSAIDYSQPLNGAALDAATGALKDQIAKANADQPGLQIQGATVPVSGKAQQLILVNLQSHYWCGFDGLCALWPVVVTDGKAVLAGSPTEAIAAYGMAVSTVTTNGLPDLVAFGKMPAPNGAECYRVRYDGTAYVGADALGAWPYCKPPAEK